MALRMHESSSFGEFRKIGGKLFSLYGEVYSRRHSPTESEIERLRTDAKEEHKYVRLVRNTYDQVAVYVRD